MTAENYHIYALLQSTILKLQLDDHLLRCVTETKKCRSNSQNTRTYPSDNCVSGNNGIQVDTGDVLQLDSFFSKLDTLDSGSRNCS